MARKKKTKKVSKAVQRSGAKAAASAKGRRITKQKKAGAKKRSVNKSMSSLAKKVKREKVEKAMRRYARMRSNPDEIMDVSFEPSSTGKAKYLSRSDGTVVIAYPEGRGDWRALVGKDGSPDFKEESLGTQADAMKYLRSEVKKNPSKKKSAKKKSTKKKTAKKASKKRSSKKIKLTKVPESEYELVWNKRKDQCFFGHCEGIGGDVGCGVTDNVEVLMDDKGVMYVLSVNYECNYACVEMFDTNTEQGPLGICFYDPNDISGRFKKHTSDLDANKIVQSMIKEMEK